MKDEIITALKEWRDSIEETALRDDDGKYLFTQSEKRDLDVIKSCLHLLGE